MTVSELINILNMYPGDLKVKAAVPVYKQEEEDGEPLYFLNDVYCAEYDGVWDENSLHLVTREVFV